MRRAVVAAAGVSLPVAASGMAASTFAPAAHGRPPFVVNHGWVSKPIRFYAIRVRRLRGQPAGRADFERGDRWYETWNGTRYECHRIYADPAVVTNRDPAVPPSPFPYYNVWARGSTNG